MAYSGDNLPVRACAMQKLLRMLFTCATSLLAFFKWRFVLHTISTVFCCYEVYFKVYMTRQSLWSFSSMVLAQFLEPHPLGELSPRLPKMTGFHSWVIMFMDCVCICFYLFAFVCHYILHIYCVCIYIYIFIYIYICVCVCACVFAFVSCFHSLGGTPMMSSLSSFRHMFSFRQPSIYNKCSAVMCKQDQRKIVRIYSRVNWLCMEAWVKLLWHVMTSSDWEVGKLWLRHDAPHVLHRASVQRPFNGLCDTYLCHALSRWAWIDLDVVSFLLNNDMCFCTLATRSTSPESLICGIKTNTRISSQFCASFSLLSNTGLQFFQYIYIYIA